MTKDVWQLGIAYKDFTHATLKGTYQELRTKLKKEFESGKVERWANLRKANMPELFDVMSTSNVLPLKDSLNAYGSWENMPEIEPTEWDQLQIVTFNAVRKSLKGIEEAIEKTSDIENMLYTRIVSEIRRQLYLEKKQND